MMVDFFGFCLASILLLEALGTGKREEQHKVGGHWIHGKKRKGHWRKWREDVKKKELNWSKE